MSEALRRALTVLDADAHDPKRAVMWRYGVQHTLTVIREALAAPPAAGLDVERLARAFHEAKKVGGPWGPCATRTADGDMVLVGFDEDPNGDFACLCQSMARHVASEYAEVSDD